MPVITNPTDVPITPVTSARKANLSAQGFTALDTTNGNKIRNRRGTILLLSGGGSGVIDFYADVNGAEVIVWTTDIVGFTSGLFAGFESDVFNDHRVSLPSANGYILCKLRAPDAGSILAFVPEMQRLR